MSAAATPIHAILVLTTVDGKPTTLMLDADAVGTAVCRQWAQQVGMKLVVEPTSPGRECSKGRIEKIRQLIERHMELIVQHQGRSSMSAAATPSLLPCPFCGATPETEEFDDEEVHTFFISCVNQDCPASAVFASGDTPEDAAELWNTRNGAAV